MLLVVLEAVVSKARQRPWFGLRRRRDPTNSHRRGLFLSVFRAPVADICHPRTGTIRDWLVLRHRYWQKRGRERRLLNLPRPRPTPRHHRQPHGIRPSRVRQPPRGPRHSPPPPNNPPFSTPPPSP